MLRKAEDRGIKYMVSSIKYGKKLNEEEKDLLRTFYQFEEVVLEAGRNFLPSAIAAYLYGLAQKYNVFYSKHLILGNQKQNQASLFRLALTHTTSKIIKKGLWLLGIETVERM